MFLENLINKNKKLVEVAIDMHTKNTIEPDTYVVDLDQTLKNSKEILVEANKKNVKLYFMLKQIGRNPIIAKELVKMGYQGAVVVDFREAETMMEHGIPLGNVGHLVQTPKGSLEKIIKYGTEVFTVFSIEKLIEINNICERIGKQQDVILKVYDDGDIFYAGQEGGVKTEELEQFVEQSKSLNFINIIGVTAFPAFLFDEKDLKIKETHNYCTILKASEKLKELGLDITHINAPSTTSVFTLQQMNDEVTHGEPGHGMTGTTPAHAYLNLIELPSVVYVSEISHNFEEYTYAYGGGHYRRSNIKSALVVTNEQRKIHEIIENDPYAIDYYFKLKGSSSISSTVLMLFRFQMFVTRSKVAIVKGIQKDEAELVGVFDSLGKEVL